MAAFIEVFKNGSGLERFLTIYGRPEMTVCGR
jgi:hypothetical protein